MENWNKSQLIRYMSSLGCFQPKGADNSTCNRLLDLLNSKLNETYGDYRKGNNYSTVNPVVIASYSLAIFLNCVSLWMMYKDPLKRFRTVSSLLIANLAVSDLLGACFSLVVESEIRQNPTQNFNVTLGPSTSTSLYLPWLIATTAQSSYYTVILISFERYAAIAHPFRYRDLVVTKSALLVTVISWLLAFGISTPLFFVHKLYKLRSYIGNQTYAINTFILVAIILVLYPLTHTSLRRQRKKVISMMTSNKTLQAHKLKVEKNFANTMFLVCFSLILFTSPYVVVFFFLTTDCNSCIINNHFLSIWMYFRIFFALHFGINPIIYALRLPCYQDSLLQMLPANIRCTRRRNQPKQRTCNVEGLGRINGLQTQNETRA